MGLARTNHRRLPRHRLPAHLADATSAALASASAGAFVILLVVAGVVVARSAESGVVAPDASAFRADPTSLSLALPVIALAYTCHFNVIEIDRELDRGGTARRHVAGVVHAATLGVSFPLYAAFSLAGYATFGANVSGDLLTEWTDDGEMAVAQAAVAVVNALKYPLVGFALRGATRDALIFARGFRLAKIRTRGRRVARGGRRRSGRRRGDEPLAREASDETLVASLVDEETDDEETDDEENLDEELDEENLDEALVARGSESAAQRPASVETPSPPPRWVFAAALFALHALVAACAVRLRSLQLALDVVGADVRVARRVCPAGRAVHRGVRPGAGKGRRGRVGVGREDNHRGGRTESDGAEDEVQGARVDARRRGG